MDTTTMEPPATVGAPEPDRFTAVPAQSDASASSGRWNAESMVGRARSDAYDTAVRLRAQIAPHAAGGAVLAAGLGMDAVVAAGGMSAPAMALTAAAVAAPTVAGLVLRARARGSEWVRRVLVGGAAAAGWLTLAPFGVEPVSVAALVAGEYALAARWWQLNRPGYPGDEHPDAVTVPAADELTVEDVPEPLTPVEQIVTDWDTYIACAGGPLQNSRLIAPQQHQFGFAFTLQLWRGRHTLTTAIAALDKLASGLDCGVDQIIVESHPLLPGEANCRFQLITNSPIAGNVVFDGPRRRDGLLELGPYADGSGEATYRLYTPGSMWSGVIIGGTGIGKSRVVENIVISALSGGDTEYWFLDPARGGSSPALAEYADWFVTMDQVDEMLDAAIAGLDARAEENAVEGWTGFTPSPQRPGLLIVFEECHNPFETAERAKKAGRIAREGRKLGMALLCISQYPGLITFGGNEALRSSVMEGNALVLRSTSNQTGGLMAGLSVDPKTLPKIPGYAYVQGSEETGVRTAPFRNRDTEPEGGPGAARWLAAQPRPGLDQLMVTATLAAGTAYRDRRTSTTTGRAGSRARVEALRNGHLPADMLKGNTETAEVPTIAQVIEFPQFRLIETAATVNQSAAGLSPSHEAVLKAVAAGAARPADIEKAVGLKHRRVAILLAELVASGHLTKTGYGRYQAAA
jgi:hypothetical protein